MALKFKLKRHYVTKKPSSTDYPKEVKYIPGLNPVNDGRLNLDPSVQLHLDTLIKHEKAVNLARANKEIMELRSALLVFKQLEECNTEIEKLDKVTKYHSNFPPLQHKVKEDSAHTSPALLKGAWATQPVMQMTREVVSKDKGVEDLEHGPNTSVTDDDMTPPPPPPQGHSHDGRGRGGRGRGRGLDADLEHKEE